MPVYWFALSFVEDINWVNAAVVFFLLHFLLYPSSNGYNSYMDNDEDSIGGIHRPLKPTRQLYIVTIVMDLTGIILSFLISKWFALAFIFYIICSRMYSYRGIRLKRFAIPGFLIVVLNQGALTFFMVYHGASASLSLHPPLPGIIAATFLIGGFYPITQVYQHDADAKDGVKTISMMLGKQGTFIFCAAMYAVAFAILYIHFQHVKQLIPFIIIQLFFVPVLVFFVRWFLKVRRNANAVDFKHTMQMNWLASTCTSLAFITLIVLHFFG